VKIVVVGSTGYIGRYLAAHLTESGDEVVTCSSKDGTGIDPDTGLLPTWFDVAPATAAVCYLAQSPRYREGTAQAWHVLNVNAVSATRVAALAAKAGVRKFIYASTGNVYSPGFAAHAESSPLRRDNLYELSKVHGEEALALFRDQLDVTVVRLFGVYGPGQSGRLIPNLASAVASGKPIVIERNPSKPTDLGGLRISLCYVDDVVKILAALLNCEGPPALNVASDEVLDIRQMATTIGNMIGRAPVFDVASRARGGDLIASIELLKRLLKPRFTPFEMGLRTMLETLKA
jgi:nucleoside-diphosphate-sugar epimerase